MTISSNTSIMCLRLGVCFIDHLLSEMSLFIHQVVYFVKSKLCQNLYHAIHERPELFSKTLAGEVGIAIPTAGWTFLGRMWWISQKSWLEWDWVDTYPIEHGYGLMDIRMVDDRPVDCDCQ
jgi:hypothetical protein